MEKLISQTNQAVALVSEQSAAKATKSPMNFPLLPDLQQRGEFTSNKQTLTLYDPRRARKFLADIYLPQLDHPAPVIVISYGLGEDRSSFEYLAQQLASHGFAVAVPENPGSNAQQIQALLAGRAKQVAEPNEFVNRALDVKFLLDELQRRSQSDPAFKVNVQQVGVIGQSFGGYTALALAGAPLNFKQLRKNCRALNNSLNVSLLLQCQALKLPSIQYNLRDKRIKAAIAINPIDSSVFGQASLSQIQVPMMLISGSADIIAPALLEQIRPFTWLTTPEKYLLVIQGGTHFSTIGETKSDKQSLAIPSQVVGPDPTVARRYVNALSVAFFQTYVAGDSKYRRYLSASYAQAISKAPLSLSLVQSLTATQLAEAIKAANKNAAKKSP
jgi:predicted dienelactone hydrolase